MHPYVSHAEIMAFRLSFQPPPSIDYTALLKGTYNGSESRIQNSAEW